MTLYLCNIRVDFCRKFKAETIILANLLMILVTRMGPSGYMVVFFHTFKIKTHLSVLNVKCVNFHAIMDTLDAKKIRYCVQRYGSHLISSYIYAMLNLYSCCCCSSFISRGPFHCFCFIVYFAHSFVLNRHTQMRWYGETDCCLFVFGDLNYNRKFMFFRKFCLLTDCSRISAP